MSTHPMRYAAEPPLPRSVAVALERFKLAMAEELPGVDFVLALASPSIRPFTTSRKVTAISSVTPDEGRRILTGLLDRLHRQRESVRL